MFSATSAPSWRADSNSIKLAAKSNRSSLKRDRNGFYLKHRHMFDGFHTRGPLMIPARSSYRRPAKGGRDGTESARPRHADILSFPPLSRQDDDLLKTVLNNLAQGVLLFDLETRLIFCNLRYLEMYRLTPESARPGRYLRDLLAQRLQQGTFAGDPDDYIARLKDGITEARASPRLPACRTGALSRSSASRWPAAAGSRPTKTSPSGSARSAQIAHMARHDALTDLPNRVLLRERWNTSSSASNAANAWRCSASISISSRASTTRSAIRSATNC